MSFLLGTYTVPEGSAAVPKNTISSAVWNALLADLATALSACLLKDGSQTVTANIPMASFKLTGLGVGTAYTDSCTVGQQLGMAGIYCTVGGTVDVITLTPTVAWTSYAAGQAVMFHAAGANTTNVTLNVSGLGAKALTKNGTTALSGSDIPSGSLVVAVYDGTRFVMKV